MHTINSVVVSKLSKHLLSLIQVQSKNKNRCSLSDSINSLAIQKDDQYFTGQPELLQDNYFCPIVPLKLTLLLSSQLSFHLSYFTVNIS